MEKNEKLKIVFDFIADYLSEESTQKEETLIDDIIDNVVSNIDDKSIVEVNLNEDDDPLKRSYAIMQKLEERDKVEAKVKANSERNKLLAELTKLKEQHQRQDAFIRKHKSMYSELICYNPENFIPIFYSEDKTYGVTVDEQGFEQAISLDEINERYVKIKKHTKIKSNDNEIGERTGVTLDDDGNLVKVKVPNLGELDHPESSIMPVMSRKPDLEDDKESESPNNIY